MVKLVDTLVSGTSGFAAVQVRVLFWAQKRSSEFRSFFLLWNTRFDEELRTGPLQFQFCPVFQKKYIADPEVWGYFTSNVTFWLLTSPDA